MNRFLEGQGTDFCADIWGGGDMEGRDLGRGRVGGESKRVRDGIEIEVER